MPGMTQAVPGDAPGTMWSWGFNPSWTQAYHETYSVTYTPNMLIFEEKKMKANRTEKKGKNEVKKRE